MRRFLLAISIAIVLEAGLAVLAVNFIDWLWARGVVLAIVPIAFVVLAILDDREE